MSRTKPVRRFMAPEALHARLAYLLAYAKLAQAHPDASTLDPLTTPEPDLDPLMDYAEHGSVGAVKLTHRRSGTMVAVSIQGRNPRLFMPLDYVAVDLACGFGLALSIQKTTSDAVARRDYPRITAPDKPAAVYQVLRLIADAKPGQVVKQKATDAHAMDHHYLGRDGLTLTTDDALRDQGMAMRCTTRGREDLLQTAGECFERYRAAGKFDLPETFTSERYSTMLQMAFALADWHHGRLDGQTPEALLPLPGLEGDRAAGLEAVAEARS